MAGAFEGVADADGVVVATDVDASLLDGPEVDDSWSADVVGDDVGRVAEDDELVESVIDASGEDVLEDPVVDAVLGEFEVEICEAGLEIPAPEPVVMISRVVKS